MFKLFNIFNWGESEKYDINYLNKQHAFLETQNAELLANVEYYKKIVDILKRRPKLAGELEKEYEPIIDRQRRQIKILSQTIDDMEKNNPSEVYIKHLISLNGTLETELATLKMKFIKGVI